MALGSLLCLARASFPHSYQQLSLNLMSFQSPVILLPCPVCHSFSSLGPVTLFLILFLKENRGSFHDLTLIEPTGPIKNNSIYLRDGPTSILSTRSPVGITPRQLQFNTPVFCPLNTILAIFHLQQQASDPHISVLVSTEQRDCEDELLLSSATHSPSARLSMDKVLGRAAGAQHWVGG